MTPPSVVKLIGAATVRPALTCVGLSAKQTQLFASGHPLDLLLSSLLNEYRSIVVVASSLKETIPSTNEPVTINPTQQTCNSGHNTGGMA